MYVWCVMKRCFPLYYVLVNTFLQDHFNNKIQIYKHSSASPVPVNPHQSGYYFSACG